MFDMKKMTDMAKEAGKIQESMKEELQNIIVNGNSGVDMVIVTMNANFEILNLKINNSIVNKNEIKFLEDLILAAINDALIKAKDASALHMKSITSKFGL